MPISPLLLGTSKAWPLVLLVPMTESSSLSISEEIALLGGFLFAVTESLVAPQRLDLNPYSSIVCCSSIIIIHLLDCTVSSGKSTL